MTVVDVAAFDVDGTLTTRDCVRPFLVSVGGWHGVIFAVLRRPFTSLRAAVRRDRDAFKTVLVGGVLRRRPIADVDAIGRQFADLVEREWLRPDTVARWRWHQRAGHRMVLVSASLAPYLRPLGAKLGAHAVLCAEPKRDGTTYGDGLEGTNCRRAEKVRRLDAWLAAEGLSQATLWAYGDSTGDTELLARADHPLWVKGIVVPAEPAGVAS